MSTLFYILLILLLVFWLEMPQFLPINLLIVRKDPAADLEEWLKSFNWGQRSQLTPETKLPQYKFYSEVVELLLSLARKMGGSYQESILYLRQGLLGDRQFEKKFKEIVQGIWLQMVMMMVLTWGFIMVSLIIVDVKVSIGKLVLIFVWQSIGLSILPIVLKHYRQKFFGDIGKFWKILYVLNSLVRVPLSRSEVLGLAQVTELKNMTQKSLQPLIEKLKESCQRSLKLGQSYEEDVKSLMEELRFQEKWHFELFEKRLVVVKLGLLAIFFLPSYLAFIFLLLGDLMTLM
jgi:hypothetical protein